MGAWTPSPQLTPQRAPGGAAWAAASRVRPQGQPLGAVQIGRGALWGRCGGLWGPVGALWGRCGARRWGRRLQTSGGEGGGGSCSD